MGHGPSVYELGPVLNIKNPFFVIKVSEFLSIDNLNCGLKNELFLSSHIDFCYYMINPENRPCNRNQ